MADQEYTCAACGGTFRSPRSDAEALMEYQEVFTEEMRAVDAGPPVAVCDVCYKAMMAECPPEQAFAEYKARNPTGR